MSVYYYKAQLEILRKNLMHNTPSPTRSHHHHGYTKHQATRQHTTFNDAQLYELKKITLHVSNSEALRRRNCIRLFNCLSKNDRLDIAIFLEALRNVYHLIESVHDEDVLADLLGSYSSDSKLHLTKDEVLRIMDKFMIARIQQMTIHRFAGAVQRLVILFLVLILIGITALLVMYLSDKTRPIFLIYIMVGLTILFIGGLIYVIVIPIYQARKLMEITRGETAAKIKELTDHTILPQPDDILNIEAGEMEPPQVIIVQLPGADAELEKKVLERYCSRVSEDKRFGATT